LKVLHITEAMGGGVASYLVDLTTEQIAAGILPTVFYLERFKTRSANIEPLGFDGGVRVIKVPQTRSKVLSYVNFMSRLKKIVRDERFDILHIHSSIAGVLARSFLPSSALRVALYTPHAWSFCRRDLQPVTAHLYRIIEKSLINRTAGVLAVSKAEKEEGMRLSKRAKVWHVDNGISLGDLGHSPHRKSRKSIRVVSVGRLCPQKDPERFNRLAETLKSEKVQFEWIGGYQPGEEGKYKYNLDSTQVTGWISRETVLDHLRLADIFVLLSAWEGMPLALLEAQALGLPALVSAVDGNDEIVINGKTGYVVEDDLQAKRMLEVLIKQPQKRLEFKKNALAKRDYWSISRMEFQIREIYNTVISKNKRDAKK
jgi:glycosyltransferase involved in cell wall biosynthesis